jgi:hypothetical protein
MLEEITGLNKERVHQISGPSFMKIGPGIFCTAAAAHSSGVLANREIPVLFHPPNFPDLAPANSFIF